MSVRDAFALEKAPLTPLPVRPYEAVKIAEPKVDYFGTVPFEGSRHSVPVKFAGQDRHGQGERFPHRYLIPWQINCPSAKKLCAKEDCLPIGALQSTT